MKKLLFNLWTNSALLLLLTILSFTVNAQKLDISQLENMKARIIGPAGMNGRIVAIDAVVENPDNIYAGAALVGVYKSIDAGKTRILLGQEKQKGSVLL